MATRNWTAKSGAWETASNWDNGAYATPPQADDTVTLPSESSAYTVTLSSSASLVSLTIGDYNGYTKPIILQLNAGASLTTTGAINVALYGTIEGQGAINAGGGLGIIYAGSGNPSILAGTASTGGTLDVTGTIDANFTLGFANAAVASTLKLETSNTFASIAITASTQKLEIGASANVIFNSTETVSNGAIQLDGGTLTASSGLSLTSATVSGTGTINAPVYGGGTIFSAAGGTLTLTSAVSYQGAATNLVLGSGSSMLLTTSSWAIGSSSSAPTVTFQGSGDTFQAIYFGLGNLYIGQISGFAAGDYIELAAFGPNDTLTQHSKTITITSASGATQTLTFDNASTAAGVKLTQVTINGVLVDQLSICFMAGTMIRTPEGEASIETLKRGDLVLTVDGAAKPVSWVGRQTISVRFADPTRSFPIRIKAGALADNVPSRDLLVSPDHALLIDGVLVHAGALVNELSITREAQVPDSFVYYHVELDDHSLILAENVPAETFVDNVERLHFDNWGEHEALYPGGRAIAEMPFPRVRSRRQLPEAIASALLERARLIGLDQRDVA